MRRIYDPITGSDVTATVQATLQSGRTLVTAYTYRFLFMIFWTYNPYGSWGSYAFTDADYPLFIKYQQLDGGVAQPIGHWLHDTFQPVGLPFYPEPITHDKLSYGIGFEDKPTEINWAIKDNKNYPVIIEDVVLGVFTTSISELLSPVNCTLKMGLQMAFFTDCPFWIHQCIFSDFPANGGTLLGTTLMFRGFIRKVSATRSKIKLALSSLMDVFQSIQVATQTITPLNRAMPYIPVATGTYGGDFAAPNVINERVLSFTTTESVPVNAMQDSWMTFNPATYAGFQAYKNGLPAAPAFRIEGNDAPSGGRITVYYYQPFALPVNQGAITTYSQTSSSVGGAPGFLYLPPPEMSA